MYGQTQSNPECTRIGESQGHMLLMDQFKRTQGLRGVQRRGREVLLGKQDLHRYHDASRWNVF